MTLRAGDVASEFGLVSQDGGTVSLSSYRGKKPVVLFFYPKDFTLVCTKEACAFRDVYSDFVSAGAEVFGISADENPSHKKFAVQHRLQYKILSDGDKSIRKAYGLKMTLGFIPERVTFVIDKEGVIRHVYSSQLMGTKHAEQALEAVRKLSL